MGSVGWGSGPGWGLRLLLWHHKVTKAQLVNTVQTVSISHFDSIDTEPRPHVYLGKTRDLHLKQYGTFKRCLSVREPIAQCWRTDSTLAQSILYSVTQAVDVLLLVSNMMYPRLPLPRMTLIDFKTLISELQLNVIKSNVINKNMLNIFPRLLGLLHHFLASLLIAVKVPGKRP